MTLSAPLGTTPLAPCLMSLRSAHARNGRSTESMGVEFVEEDDVD